MGDQISTRNITSLCRVCLTASQNLVPIADTLDKQISNVGESWTIGKMIEFVTHKVLRHSELFPNCICPMCISLLKISFEFQTQFKKSQEMLQKELKEIPIAKPCEEFIKPAPVELIFGDHKFDLNDVLVVEDDAEERPNFDGFLNNLGSEVSATFVGEHPIVTQQKKDTVFIESVNNYEPHLSTLQVKNIPEKSMIVVEEVIETAEEPIRKPVKTLYECNNCKKLFEKRNNLNRHKDICGGPQFICEKCGHIALTQSQLYHHLQNHKGKRFPCDICGKKFVTTSRLKAHVEVHQNQRSHLCSVCGKGFNYSTALQYHMRLHTGEKKFVCNFCGLRYRMSNTLKRHLRTHTKDKPYPCNYCSKRFSSRGEQSCHEMVHTGERPYSCEYCGKGYIKTSNLQYHYLSHEGDHACQVCSRTFIDIKFLALHMKQTHDGEIQEDDEEETYNQDFMNDEQLEVNFIAEDFFNGVDGVQVEEVDDHLIIEGREVELDTDFFG